MYKKKSITVYLILFALIAMCNKAQTDYSILVNSKKGHPIKTGSSGFNIRIADMVRSYTHPGFVKIVNQHIIKN